MSEKETFREATIRSASSSDRSDSRSLAKDVNKLLSTIAADKLGLFSASETDDDALRIGSREMDRSNIRILKSILEKKKLNTEICDSFS